MIEGTLEGAERETVAVLGSPTCGDLSQQPTERNTAILSSKNIEAQRQDVTGTGHSSCSLSGTNPPFSPSGRPGECRDPPPRPCQRRLGDRPAALPPRARSFYQGPLCAGSEFALWGAQHSGGAGVGALGTLIQAFNKLFGATLQPLEMNEPLFCP